MPSMDRAAMRQMDFTGHTWDEGKETDAAANDSLYKRNPLKAWSSVKCIKRFRY